MESRNLNHPKKGSTIKVQPIRSKTAIGHIKGILSNNKRDLCLFTLGINTAYRANELLSLHYSQVKNLSVGDELDLKQSKTDKNRMVTLNKNAVSALQNYLKYDGRFKKLGSDDCYLFYSRRGEVLKVPTVSNMVKEWCRAVGLEGNYGSHTLRKTWGYWQYKRGTPLPLLMVAFGHATQQQTLAYLCIQAKEVKDIYGLEL